jgi:hypothetical protein
MLVAPGSCVAVFVLSVVVAPAGFVGPSRVPARLAQARYVALAYDLGDGLLSESEAVFKPTLVTPEDREALNAVRSQLEKWGRYAITLRPAQAELLVAVRTGRRGSASTGFRIGGGRDGVASTGSVATGGSYGGSLSSADDMLSVYEVSGGSHSLVLWRGQRSRGLSGASPALFEEFKADVERAAKQP